MKLTIREQQVLEALVTLNGKTRVEQILSGETLTPLNKAEQVAQTIAGKGGDK